jgi:tRNA threonylcarbamoyladenosine biosynthesis protein TsaE
MRTATLTIGGKKMTFTVKTAEEWSSVTKKLIPSITPGSILAVSGDLGAGKTTFIQALAKALGVRRFVPSPTFALMRSYVLPKKVNGISRLVHVDAYRLESEAEILALDLDEELADGKSLLVIEWPERIPNWLARRKPATLQII